MKEQLCKDFSDHIAVRVLPSGLAVSTGFSYPDGDRIGFYLQRDGDLFHIQDSGLVLPTLEASGLDLKNQSRADALNGLLLEYGVQVDEGDREFQIAGLREDELSAGALRFVSFMLRVGDLLLLSEERVASTFRLDVERMLRESLGDRALISEHIPLNSELTDFSPDFTITASDRPPVGVFLGTNDARVLEALYMQMRAEHETHSKVAIIALLEREKAVSARVRQQATNRLTAVAHFRGDEAGAISRIAKEVGSSVH